MLRKKILFTISSLGWGGAETHFIRLVNQLVNYYDIEIYIFVRGGKLETTLDKRLKIFYSIQNPKLKESTISELISFFKLTLHLFHNKYDLVFSMMDHVNLIQIFAHKFSFHNSILLVGVHNNPILKYHDKFNVKKKIIFKLIECVYSYPDLIIGCSEGVANAILRICINAKVIAMPNAGFENSHLQLRQIRKLKEEININCINLISCGRLIRQKRFDRLIEVFFLISKSIKIKLKIIGEGPEYHNLKNLIKKYNLTEIVSIINFSHSPFEHHYDANGLVMFSEYEGSPQVLIEAMAIGIPVIYTNCDYGPREIIVNKINGFLLNKEKSNAELANEIIEILGNQILLEQISENSISTIIDRSANEVAIAHKQLFSKLFK